MGVGVNKMCENCEKKECCKKCKKCKSQESCKCDCRKVKNDTEEVEKCQRK